MSLFAKNVVHFGFSTSEMECDNGKQAHTKMPEKQVSKNITKLVYFNY